MFAQRIQGTFGDVFAFEQTRPVPDVEGNRQDQFHERRFAAANGTGQKATVSLLDIQRKTPLKNFCEVRVTETILSKVCRVWTSLREHTARACRQRWLPCQTGKVIGEGRCPAPVSDTVVYELPVSARPLNKFGAICKKTSALAKGQPPFGEQNGGGQQNKRGCV